MNIFLNILLKTTAIFVSIISVILLSLLIISFIDDKSDEFVFYSGNEESDNIIGLIKLNGIIIEKNQNFPNFTNPYIISPLEVKKELENIESLSPKIIIFMINSPGGTVSASNNLYNIISSYKKKNDVEILFHTNELLASGGYWAAAAGDEIFASYGSNYF